MKIPRSSRSRPNRRNGNDRRRVSFFDQLEPRTLLCDVGSVKWTFGATQTNDYVLSSYSAFDANVGPVDTTDPTLQLVIGTRYVVTVADPVDHPLQIIAKAATSFDDRLLLSQVYGDPIFDPSQPPLFQTDPGVDFVNDEADKSIAFTLTQALADAMSDPTHGLVPGYRCGNPFHRDFQRGDLILTSGAPVAPDPSNPAGSSISDPIPIALDASGGGSQAGSIGEPGQVGVYQFVAPVSGTITVTQRAASGSALDSILFAYDASGGMIGENGDGGGGKDSRLSFKVNSGGVYYVQASGYAGSTGNYDLTFTSHPLGSIVGGGTVDARPIVLDSLGATDLSGQIAVPAEKHDYQFTATISGQMTITEAHAAGSPLDSLMTVFNDSGVVVAANDDYPDGGLDSRVTIGVVAGQSYTVRAAGLGLSDGPYNLSISTADVGNTPQDAGTINLSSSNSGSRQGHIGMGLEEDLYQLQATTSGVMTTLLDSQFNGTVTVLDATGNNTLFDYDNIGTSGRVSFPVTQGETFFVRVSAYGDETGVFTLYFSGDDNPGTFAGAPAIPLSSLAFASQIGEIGLPGATDYYSFIPPISGTMILSMDAIDGTSIDSNLTVYDSSRQHLASNDNDGSSLNSRLELPVQAGRVYYVQAGASRGTIGRYNLTLADVESQGALATPTIIPVDGSGSGRASGVISLPGDVETFQFAAATTGPISIRLDAQPDSHLDGELTLLDGQGNVIGTDDDGGGGYNSLVTINEVAGRSYEIRASGFETSIGSFDLILGDDYGNDPAHAFPISLDTQNRASLSGQIDPAGDVDVFKLVAPTSGPLTVSLTQPSTGPIASLAVLNASGAVIVGDPSGNGIDNRVVLAMVQGQTYYIRVAGLGRATGAYDLGLAVESGPGAQGSAGQVVTPDPASGLADLSGEVVLAGNVRKYLYTSPVAGLLVISQTPAPGSLLAGSLTLPNGEAPPDDANTPFPKGYSRVTLDVTPGQTVAIEVGGIGTSTGKFLLDLRILPISNQVVTTTSLLPTDPTQVDPTQQYVTPADLAASLVGPNVMGPVIRTIRVVPGTVHYQGAPNASGLFAGGAGLLDTREQPGSAPLDSGVILTNGDASGVTGPNVDDARSGVNGVPGVPDLDKLVMGGTIDASVLSFDFIPATNLVQIRYVFSSEEYNKYVGSPFDDAFGIFINGTDYARVPGTGSPAAGTGDIVSVNTINDHTNSQDYIDNTFSPSGSYGRINLAMNGLTVVLTLTAPVNAGQVNSIKLAIADTVDPRFDSAVFVQAGSFQSVVETVPNGLGQAQLAQYGQALTSVRATNPGLSDEQVNFLANQSTIDGTIKHLGLNGDYLVIPVDPIDFTLTGPDGLKVASNDGVMTTNVPNAFFASSGGNDLLIVPNASRGIYKVDLVGLGSGDFLFGASFISTSKDVTTDLVQGNLQMSGAEAILDFQDLMGGVRMVSTIDAPSPSNPSGSPEPLIGSNPAPSPEGSTTPSSQGLLATAVNALIVGLTTQIFGSPGSTGASSGGVSSVSSQNGAEVASASPAQPVTSTGTVGRFGNSVGPESPEGPIEKPKGVKALDPATMDWLIRVLGLASKATPRLQILQLLLEAASSWIRPSTAVGPRSSIEGRPSKLILPPQGIPIEGDHNPTTILEAFYPQEFPTVAQASNPGEFATVAEGPTTSAIGGLLSMVIAPLHWFHGRTGRRPGGIKNRRRPGCQARQNAS